MTRKIIDLTNKIFGNLTVLYRAGSTRSGGTSWLCRCNCGSEVVISSDHLTRSVHPVKSCGCVIKQRIGEKHPQWNGYGEISGSWWACHIMRERNEKYRKRVPVEINKQYAWELFLKQERKCALSGIKLIISTDHHQNTASIDRIDNSKGYIEGNVQWVHKHVNFMKCQHSQQYFIDLCKKIARNNS